MYKDHPCFTSPENEDVKIWRYLDLTKYVRMLDKSSLFFARADRLNDQFEGSFTNANIKHRPEMYVNTRIPTEYFLQLRRIFKAIKAFTAINSWHLNDFESAAMWKLYVQNNQGIAILSTFKKLKECLKDAKPNIFIGKIKYVDWENYIIPEGNTFYAYVHKRKSFEYEQELRAIVQEFSEGGGEINLLNPLWENGLEVEVDLNLLVEKIYLSPSTPDWIYDVIRSVTNRYGYTWEINRSTMDASPVY